MKYQNITTNYLRQSLGWLILQMNVLTLHALVLK